MTDEEQFAETTPEELPAHVEETRRLNAYTLQSQLQFWIAEVHTLAVSKGWYNNPEHDHIAIRMNRVIAEAMELCEEYARGREDHPSDKITAFTRAEEEWADTVIRLLDIAGWKRYRPQAITAKIEYNRTRPLMHGGKKF